MNFNQANINSLLLAVIIHILLLGMFVFTFPIKPEPHKPSIAFLGPILKLEDTTIKPKPPLLKQNEYSYVPPRLIKTKTENKYKPYSDRSVGKPKGVEEVKSTPKRILKSTFIQNEIDSENQDFDVNSLGIDLNKPVYKPLRFNTK